MAFAPIEANSLGQLIFGADTLQFLWNLAYHQAKNTFAFAIDLPAYITSQFLLPSTQQESDYRHRRLRGLKYHENRLRLLTCVFEGVTTRIIGQTFNLTCSPEYYRWLENTHHNWLPMQPTYDLASQDSVLSQNSDQPVQAQFSQNSPTTSSNMSISRNYSRSPSDMSISRNVSQFQSQLTKSFLGRNDSFADNRSGTSSRG